MKRIYEHALGARAFCAAAFFVCAVCSFAFAQDKASAINDVELVASSRGLIMILTGSDSMAVGGNAADLEKTTASYAELRVRISMATSSMRAASLTPPDALPVSEIVLKENVGGIELSVKMRRTVNGPVRIRGGNNQVRIFLTGDPQPEMVWSAMKGITSGSKGAPASVAKPAQSASPAPTAAQSPDAERVLNDIRIVERDNSFAMYFDFSGTPAAAVSRWDDSVVVTFAHSSVSPRLGVKTHTAKGSAAYGTVRLSQKKDADRRNVVVASVRLNRRGVSPAAAVEDTKYVLRVPGNTQNKVFLWSALSGVQSTRQFAEITPEPVDMKKMEARAARDMQPLSGDGSFSVGGATPQAPAKQAASGAGPQIAPARPEVPVAEVPPAHDSETDRVTQDGKVVRYKVFGRDPFVPLVRDTGLTEYPRVENLKLVGVLEDGRESIALLEDFTNNNRAFALRVNDPVEYGKVLRVDRNKVVFLIRDFDVSRTYTLDLSRDAQSGKARGR